MGRGRPPGSRNKSIRPAQALFDRYAEQVVGKCLSQALKGDAKALQLCLDRILPVRREVPLKLGKLPVGTIQDLSRASEKVMAQVVTGRLTATQGQAVSEMIERRRKVIETEELDRRLRALEDRS